MVAITRRAFLVGGFGACAALRAQGPAGGYLPAERVTAGPRHHFFGYFDTCPWDAAGRYILAHETEFVGRQPKPGEEIVLGCVDRAAANTFRPFARTAAWCWQLGSLARWLPSEPERAVIYNVRRGDRWGAEIFDVALGTKRAVPFPIYSVDPTGTLAVSLNPSRLAWTRPGYGFEGIEDPGRHVAAPEDDGLFTVDLRAGTSRLILSLAALARFRPLPVFAEAYHWVNHLLFSPDGSRFLFLHRFRRPGEGWATRLYTATPDGGNLRLLLDHALVSHFSWRDQETFIVWARHPSHGDRYYLIDERTGSVEVVGKETLTEDGHMSYSPDRRWIVTDTYPDRRGQRALFLVRARDGRRIDIGSFISPPAFEGPARCDLHPRWSRDGLAVCVDSAHEETRQVYVIDVSRYTG